MIKGGCNQETIFHSVNVLTEKGLSVREAIAEIEAILRGKLPDSIKDRIYHECR